MTTGTPAWQRFWDLLDAVPVPADAEYLYDPATAAGARRRRNLHRYLRLARGGGADRLLIAEAPGWRGMSVTGLPFYSVREAEARPGLLTGSPDGDGVELPPDPPALWEASARDVWRVLARRHGPLPLSWPIYPHHPHEPCRPRTNRTPRAAEVRTGAPVALALIAALEGPELIAVGRKAQGALAAAGIAAPAVRHPAQGGARLFAEQLAALGI
ncbi:MAG: hypothetical protein HY996_11170 [Micrococcales bacterium]|nr:hypothetical protein [Micrococcales bacterium]